jgi:hypothetical protein
LSRISFCSLNSSLRSNYFSASCSWREASLNDDSFISFLRDPKTFLSAFAISSEARHLLLDIFQVDSSERIKIGAVVARVKEIRRWSKVDVTDSLLETENA